MGRRRAGVRFQRRRAAAIARQEVRRKPGHKKRKTPKEEDALSTIQAAQKTNGVSIPLELCEVTKVSVENAVINSSKPQDSQSSVKNENEGGNAPEDPPCCCKCHLKKLPETSAITTISTKDPAANPTEPNISQASVLNEKINVKPAETSTIANGSAPAELSKVPTDSAQEPSTVPSESQVPQSPAPVENNITEASATDNVTSVN